MDQMQTLVHTRHSQALRSRARIESLAGVGNPHLSLALALDNATTIRLAPLCLAALFSASCATR